jgi:REP element-mobilizing transposase RayT
MPRMSGYMIVWTTYGTRLQGNERGYVKDRRYMGAHSRLRGATVSGQKDRAVRFNRQEREIVRKAIRREAGILGQKIHSMAVCSSHVYMVVNCIDGAIGDIIGCYKKAAIEALKANGFVGKVWTKGYDKKYCFDEESLRDRIDYVQMHDKIKKNE